MQHDMLLYILYVLLQSMEQAHAENSNPRPRQPIKAMRWQMSTAEANSREPAGAGSTHRHRQIPRTAVLLRIREIMKASTSANNFRAGAWKDLPTRIGCAPVSRRRASDLVL
jgi:hypothetical protein